ATALARRHVDRHVGRPAVRSPGLVHRRVAIADHGVVPDGDEPGQAWAGEHARLEIGGRWRSLREGDGGREHVWPVDVGGVRSCRGADARGAGHGQILSVPWRDGERISRGHGTMRGMAMNLSDGEEVVLDLHPHWGRLFIPVLVLLLACLLAGFGVALIPKGGGQQIERWILIAIAAVVVIWRTILPYLRW